MNGIDPKYVFWLGVIVSVELGIGQGVVPLSDMFPADWVHWIKGWSAGLAFVGATIMTALTGYSSSKPGPLVNVPAGPTMTVVKILLVAFALSAFLAVPSAQAQTAIRKPAVTGNIPADIKTDLGIGDSGVKLTGNPEKDIQALWKRIVSASNADLKYASALAGSANTASSRIRQQCWDAIIVLNDQANGANLKNPDGTPMVKPDPSLFTNVESLAEVIDNLSPQGPLFTSCAGAAQLAKTNTLTFINAVVTGAAGIAALPAGL